MPRRRLSSFPPRYAVSLLAISVLFVALSGTASAEPASVVLRLKGGLGLGGDYASTTRLDAVGGDGYDSDTVEEAMLPSFGGAVQAEAIVHENVAVGVSLATTSWGTRLTDELNLTRNRLFDFDLVVRGQLPLPHGLSAYLLLPVGLSVNSFSDGAQQAFGAALGHGVGWNASAFVGSEWSSSGGGGIFLELGLTWRSFTHATEGQVFGAPAEVDIDGRMAQFAANLGFAFEL